MDVFELALRLVRQLKDPLGNGFGLLAFGRMEIWIEEFGESDAGRFGRRGILDISA